MPGSRVRVPTFPPIKAQSFPFKPLLSEWLCARRLIPIVRCMSYDIALWVIKRLRRGLSGRRNDRACRGAGSFVSGSRRRAESGDEARRLCQRSARPLNAPRVFTPVKGIADTGVLVALANANDALHSWATQIVASVTEPLLTCGAVLAEAAFHLEARRWLSQC